MDRRRFEEFKNFANKIWNGSRFVFMNLEGFSAESLSEGLDLSLLSLEDRWILSLLNRTIEETNRSLTEYTFDRAATRAYDFFWNDFCATYVELAKPILFGKVGTPVQKANKQKLLVILLSNAIRLMHPISPFITEEIFSLLRAQFPLLEAPRNCDPYTRETLAALLSPACITAPYPALISAKDINPEIEKTFDLMNEMVRAVRNIRAEMQIPPSEKTELLLFGPEHSHEWKTARAHPEILTALTPTSNIVFADFEPSSPGASALVGHLKLIVPIPASLLAKEKTRLEKEREKLEKLKESTEAKLSNGEFRARAPTEIVQKLEQTLHQTIKQLAEIASKLHSL